MCTLKIVPYSSFIHAENDIIIYLHDPMGDLWLLNDSRNPSPNTHRGTNHYFNTSYWFWVFIVT